jgi:hypothetical protein
MLTPIWMLIYATQPEALLRLMGLGFRLCDGEQVAVRLGDSAERLMRHRGYRRVGRKWRQVSGE